MRWAEWCWSLGKTGPRWLLVAEICCVDDWLAVWVCSCFDRDFCCVGTLVMEALTDFLRPLLTPLLCLADWFRVWLVLASLFLG